MEGTERCQEKKGVRGDTASADPPAVLLLGIVTDPSGGRAPDLADSAGEGRAKRRLLAMPPSRVANGRGLRVSSSLISGRGVAINVD